MGVVVIAGGSVWALVSAVLDFWASLALNAFTIPSNPFFATVYPSSRPKSIPLATPSSNFSSNFPPKSCSMAFRPFLYPSSYARFHNTSRFSLSNVKVAVARKVLIVLMSASLIKSRNATCMGVVMVCEIVGTVTLAVVGVDVISLALTWSAVFDRFGCCLKFLLAICDFLGSFVSGNGLGWLFFVENTFRGLRTYDNV